LVAEADLGGAFADEGEVFGSDAEDGLLEEGRVVAGAAYFGVGAEAGLAGVGEAEAELGHASEFLGGQSDRGEADLVEDWPEVVAGAGVVGAAARRDLPCRIAAEDDLQARDEDVWQHVIHGPRLTLRAVRSLPRR
jgi:hypothetical protein